MTTPLRFTSADLEAFPEDGRRYEIIDGDLHVSKQPHFHHQLVCTRVSSILQQWSEQAGNGQAVIAPGVIFADDDDVAPDVVWLSSERQAAVLGSDGKLHAAPELMVEVLSPGPRNEMRDRDAKLKLYSRCGVDEYWIVDWRHRCVDVFRRQGARLILAETLSESGVLATPLLPGCSSPVSGLFSGLKSAQSA